MEKEDPEFVHISVFPSKLPTNEAYIVFYNSQKDFLRNINSNGEPRIFLINFDQIGTTESFMDINKYLFYHQKSSNVILSNINKFFCRLIIDPLSELYYDHTYESYFHFINFEKEKYIPSFCLRSDNIFFRLIYNKQWFSNTCCSFVSVDQEYINSLMYIDMKHIFEYKKYSFDCSDVTNDSNDYKNGKKIINISNTLLSILIPQSDSALIELNSYFKNSNKVLSGHEYAFTLLRKLMCSYISYDNYQRKLITHDFLNDNNQISSLLSFNREQCRIVLFQDYEKNMMKKESSIIIDNYLHSKSFSMNPFAYINPKKIRSMNFVQSFRNKKLSNLSNDDLMESREIDNYKALLKEIQHHRLIFPEPLLVRNSIYENELTFVTFFFQEIQLSNYLLKNEEIIDKIQDFIGLKKLHQWITYFDTMEFKKVMMTSLFIIKESKRDESRKLYPQFQKISEIRFHSQWKLLRIHEDFLLQCDDIQFHYIVLYKFLINLIINILLILDNLLHKEIIIKK